MPTLDWLHREAAFQTAAQVPTRVLRTFVCALTDGRLLVAQYKGEHLRGVPREIEKGQVGKVWAGSSGGSAVFAMLFKLEGGMGISAQIDVALAP